jgi:hypothetical protein
MLCQFCHRDLGTLEPIYRLPLGPVVGKGKNAWLCKGCLGKSGPIWLQEMPLFREQSCEHCRRPVFTPAKWKLKRAICSAKCRGALDTARAKLARALRRSARECPCCRRKFTPKRIDGRYCSVACKQVASRNNRLTSAPFKLFRKSGMMASLPVVCALIDVTMIGSFSCFHRAGLHAHLEAAEPSVF